jgi:hypothetical protein
MLGPILESPRLPLTVPQVLHNNRGNSARDSSWRGCVVRSLLGSDVFSHGPMMWMG